MTLPTSILPPTRPLPGIDHGSSRDIRRSMELYKYYQPPTQLLQIPNEPACLPGCPSDGGLISSPDPALSSFTLLTANLLSCKRSMISLIDQERIYLVAESTRTLSITYPHTHAPGDGLWLGGCLSVPREGGLCERTISLLAPDEIIGKGMLIFEVPDLTQEPLYQNKDYVTNWPSMKYYAGVPLRTRTGFSIGSLCVIDDQARPNGLKEDDKLTLAKMAETVMGHLERVQAERDMKRGRSMELGISRFLAGNFWSERAELDDDGADGEILSNEQRSLEKKSMEAERLRWVDQVRKPEQQYMRGTSLVEEGVKTMKISPKPTNGSRRRKESDPFARDFATDLGQPSTAPEDLWPGSSNIGLVNVKTSQIPFSFPSLQPEDFASTLHFPVCSSPLPELSRKCSYSSVKSGRSITGARPVGSSTSTSSLGATLPLSPSPSGSLFHDSDSAAHYSAATTPTGQLQSPSPDINNSFRSTFARASVLIRKSIQVDGVVFIDADLGDTYDVDDYMEPPQTLPQTYSDSTKHPQRPKKYRRRSGILGFATKSGSSCSNPFNSDSLLCRRGSELEKSLGFDIGEVNEPFLHSMAHRLPQGHIFSCNQPKPHDADTSSVDHRHDSEEFGSAFEMSSAGRKYREDIETLKRFLPGSTGVVCMPLYDFSGKLFAVGFAWSSSKTRVFCEDVEKSYMAAFGNSIMAEVGRLHCISADKAKGDFISSVSHELRSPLHGILASAEFLADTNLDSFQRSFVDTIESCGRTLLDTINHVLDFSKLNSIGNKWTGTRSSTKKESIVRRVSRQRERSASVSYESPDDFRNDNEEPKLKYLVAENLSAPVSDVDHLTAETDLSAILEEVTEGVFAGYEFRGISTPGIMEVVGTAKLGADGKPVARTKNDITVIIDIDKHDDGWVFETQPGALRRIFLNLGGNAIKYTDSGWVRIRMKVEDLPKGGEEEEGKSLVTLIFTDSGKGISREFLKTRLFTPFSQENPLVSGTGLGMSIVKQIIEMLGGEIDVKSQPGKGTEVTVSLVLKRCSKAKPSRVLEETEIQDTEVERIRQKTQGGKIYLVGFESSPSESEVQVRATSYLRNSLERYITEWFGMGILPHSTTSCPDTTKVDFIISHEGAMVNAHLARTKDDGKKKPGQVGGIPLIVICSNAARHEIYQPLNTAENKGIVDFVSKPCGPMKLAKALISCFDKVEALPKVEVAAKPTPAKSDVHASQPHPCKDKNRLISQSAKPPPTECAVMLKTTTKVAPPRPKGGSAEIVLETKNSLTIDIPVSATQSTLVNSEGSPILKWKREVERISSLSLDEGDKKLPCTLIVEDNPVNLMLLATFLKKKGYPFEKSTNGLEAFQAVEKRPDGFDIILMDLQMPVMSGIESTRAIRRLERQRRRKGSLIIALTGLATANDQIEAFEGGIDLFMVKPVSFKHLEKTLREFKLEDQDWKLMWS